MAAGEEKRWSNALGMPKQLVPVFGERLIDRTIRQLKDRGCKSIYVTVAERGQFGDLDNDVIECIGKYREYELGKFMNVPSAIYTPVTLFWGDCFFTDEAMDTIFDGDKQHTYRFYGRETPGEIFAVKASLDVMMAATRTLYPLRRCMSSLGSWHLYRFFHNIQLNDHIVTDGFTEINDLTEDFDKLEDYKQWLARGGSAV